MYIWRKEALTEAVPLTAYIAMGRAFLQKMPMMRLKSDAKHFRRNESASLAFGIWVFRGHEDSEKPGKQESECKWRRWARKCEIKEQTLARVWEQATCRNICSIAICNFQRLYAHSVYKSVCQHIDTHRYALLGTRKEMMPVHFSLRI